MWSRLAVWLASKLLSGVSLSTTQRNLLTAAVLDKLGALPFRDILTITGSGQLLLQGRSLDIEKVRQLQESAKAALQSQALLLIREQVAFTAVTNGVHKAEDEKQILFARAALWWGQQEHSMLRLLAQEEQEPTL